MRHRSEKSQLLRQCIAGSRLRRLVTIVIVTSMLVGCINNLVDHFPGHKPIPSETVTELALRGASLGSTSRQHNPLPDDIGAAIYPESPQMVYSGNLGVLILPNDFVNANRNSGRFYYAFSKYLGNDVYELLLNQRFAVDNVPIRTFIELYVVDGLLVGMESLSEIADFYLNDSPFILPVDASHLELHFLSDDNPDADPIFVDRWELTGFYGYDLYLAPLVAIAEQ